ncbi:MAG: transcription antitermination factor NusB [Pseudomonadota bacterium]
MSEAAGTRTGAASANIEASNKPGRLPTTQPTGPTGLACRRASLRALEACFFRGQPLDDAFAPLRTSLSASDAGLAWAICQEVARERLRLKTLKTAFLKRGLPKNAAAVGMILDIALVQLLKLDVAPHAAISTAVELAKRDKRPAVKSHAKLINGVLRNALRKRAAGALYLPPAHKALPDWLVKRWRSQYGQAGIEALAQCYLTSPPLHVTAKSPDAQGQLLRHSSAFDFKAHAAFPAGTALTDLPGFESGAIWAQDRCAALPALILNPPKGAVCYDLCAAPGGKTMQLAAMGADVVAVDSSKTRLERLKQNLKRTNMQAEIVHANVSDWVPPVAADYILLDAPCTALGTFQRHPDVVHHRRAVDITSRAALQADILRGAWKALNPGGVLVYAVCSLEPEEGEALLDAFVSEAGDAERVPITAEDYGLPKLCETPSGGIATAPHHVMESGGGDGFYIAKLRRKTA